MILDLVLYGMVLALCLFGALRGAARQLTHLFALGTAYTTAPSLGSLLKDEVPNYLDGVALSLPVATGIAFVAVLLGVGVLLHVLLRRLIVGDDLQRRRI